MLRLTVLLLHTSYPAFPHCGILSYMHVWKPAAFLCPYAYRQQCDSCQKHENDNTKRFPHTSREVSELCWIYWENQLILRHRNY